MNARQIELAQDGSDLLSYTIKGFENLLTKILIGSLVVQEEQWKLKCKKYQHIFLKIHKQFEWPEIEE